MTKYNILFFIAWVIWLVGHVIQQSALFMDSSNFVLKAIYVISFLFLLLYEIFSAFTYKKSDIVAFAFLFIFALPIFEGISSVFIQGLAFIVIGRHIEFSRLARITFFSLIIVTSIIIVFSWIGIIPDLKFSEASGRDRASLGFTYPSRYPNFLFTLTLLAIYIIKKDRPIAWVLAPAILAYLVFRITGSRGPFLSVECALLFYVIVRVFHLDFSKKPFVILFGGVFFIGAFVIIGLSFFYDPSVPWLKYINDITSNRLLYSHNAFLTQAPTFFGTELFSQSEVNLTVGYLDSAYLQLLLSFGIIPFFCVLGLLTRSLVIALKSNNTYLAICLICIALHAVLEWQLTWLIYTPFLFVLFKTNKELSSA